MVMMSDTDARFALIMKLIAEQTPALFAVEGVVFEGHIQACLGGVITAVARPYGTREPRCEWRWDVETVTDFGPLEVEPAEEEEDPLMGMARAMVGRAHEFSELSLAERLLRNRTPPRGDGV